MALGIEAPEAALSYLAMQYTEPAVDLCPFSHHKCKVHVQCNMTARQTANPGNSP